LRPLRVPALDALVDLIDDIKSEKAKGAGDAQLAPARAYQRKGQFMIDFCRLGQLSLHGGPLPSHNPANIARLEAAGK